MPNVVQDGHPDHGRMAICFDNEPLSLVMVSKICIDLMTLFGTK